MNLRDGINKWAEMRPNFYVAAGDHMITCHCNDCVTFLATTGLDYCDDPAWAKLAAEDVCPDGQMLNGDQSRRFHRLVVRHL